MTLLESSFCNPTNYEIIKKRIDLLKYEIEQSEKFGKELPRSAGVIAEDIISNIVDFKSSLLRALDFIRNDEVHEIKASHLRGRKKDKKGFYRVSLQKDNSIWTAKEYLLYQENTDKYFLDFVDLSAFDKNFIDVYIFKGSEVEPFAKKIESKNHYCISFTKIIQKNLVKPLEIYRCYLKEDSLEIKSISLKEIEKESSRLLET